ncbi:FG-GAP-like repeat-containing protein [Desulfomicrobium escambiense]|uniref:FG-GAP-like repeat-containing protein n=1 Tax=Desulfomicrobium escambiense TaxID=29503 RepID=UPI00040B0A78|nr:FG-GAP-like repeat-containing protein [Desulfomicrobium escambiense]
MFKRLLACLAVLLLCAAPALAQQAKTFAVLPFGVHGPQEYQYLSQGIQSMLTTRLTWPDNFTPLDAGAVKKSVATPPADATAAEKIRQTLGVDYLVWGSLTIMGQECSLDVNTLDPAGANQPRPVQTQLNQVIPTLETVAADINAQVFKRPETATAAAQPVAKPMNQALIVNETQSGTAYANPSLKYEDADTSMGRWRSQTLSFASRGMVVCDGDGDGKNEVFLMTDSSLFAYRVTNGEMRQVAELELPKNRNYVRLNSIDLNRDGRHELVVSSAIDQKPSSLIAEFNGNLSITEDNIPYFLGVLNMPPAFTPTLVGQGVGKTKYMQSSIHQMVKTGGKFELGPAISLPMGGNVFNVTFLPFEDSHQILMIDDYDRMRVFSATGSLLTVTEETYAGSNLGVEYHPAALGLKAPDAKHSPQYTVYIPLRAIPCNLDKDNRFELIISRNISVSAQMFSNYRDYPQGEMHSLYWDGVGMSLQWKTSRIKGTIADYALADLDNDGVLDLVVSVNSHTGMTGTARKKTTVVAYPLDLSQSGGEIQKTEQ